MKNINDEHIKNQLKNMPTVKDHTTKEEWIKRIEPYKYTRKRTRKKHSKMIPIFSTALLIGIMFLIIPSIIKGPSTSINDLSSSTTYDMDTRMLPEGGEGDEFGSASINNGEIQIPKGKYVVYEISDAEQIVYGGTFDQQVQYTIPLAFITANNQSLTDAYNELDTYLGNVDPTERIPYFKGVTFDIELEEKIVTMHVPDDYTIGEGSAIPGKFEDMLSLTFYPYGIEKIIIQNEDGSPVTLGKIGELPSVHVKTPEPENYKYYYDDAYEQAFLIPIEQGEASFTDAILDLKNGDEDFLVQETLPKDMELSIACESEECVITFEDGIQQLSEDELTLAIESILMTSKSYGFNQITFEGLSHDVLGEYDFSQPIEVPLAVNPVQIKQ